LTGGVVPEVFVARTEKLRTDAIRSELTPKIDEKIIKGTNPIGGLKSMSAFLVKPSGVKFETQEADETIVLLLRQHIIKIIPWVLFTILLFCIPFFFPIISPIFNLQFVPTRFQFIGILLWYLLTLSFAFQNFLMWYYNIYIVTNHRVIDVDFFSLLYKTISDAPLEKIQDVTYSMGGVGSALFNYGNVFIQTAAEVPNFEFLSVPTPDKVVKTIVAFMQKSEES
jgi:membrane protein YdbS with pleckstrin-like domain